MALRVRNYLPKNDTYAESKTELQWRKENRALLPNAKGEYMWNNRYCQITATYYALDETRPATIEEIAVWQAERQIRKKELRRKHREAELAKITKEKARKEQLITCLRQYIDLSPADIICLDTETTGLHGNDEILQLSIISGNGEVLINEYFRPKNLSEWPEAEAINGISPEMVADKPTIDRYIPQLNKIIASAKLLIGYNLSFDIKFIRRAGVNCPCEIPTFDVMLEFAKILGRWSEYHQNYRWHKLCDCADYFGYNGSSCFHDSLSDVQATLHCYYAMTKMNESELKGN